MVPAPRTPIVSGTSCRSGRLRRGEHAAAYDAAAAELVPEPGGILQRLDRDRTGPLAVAARSAGDHFAKANLRPVSPHVGPVPGAVDLPAVVDRILLRVGGRGDPDL